MKNLSILVILLLSFGSLLSQDSITVNGYAFLEYETVHNEIKVIFQRFIPDSITTNTKSDISGYYEIKIPKGIYKITFEKVGFRANKIDELPLFDNKFLDSIFLKKSPLYGNLKGILNKWTYFIRENIKVASNDTLIIKPGVILKFDENVRFDVYGLLISIGDDADTIRFTAEEQGKGWGGIHFNSTADSNSILDKCIVEFSSSGGITCDSASPKLKNLIVQDNKKINYGDVNNNFDGSGIFLLNSKATVDHCIIRRNKGIGYKEGNWADGGGITIYGSNPKIKNTFIYDNYSYGMGGGIYIRNVVNAQIYNCIIVRNSSFLYGGGIYISNDYSNNNVVFINLTVADNYSNFQMKNNNYNNQFDFYYNAKGEIVNCIFFDKTRDGTYFRESSKLKIINSLFWDYRNKNNLQKFDKWLGVPVQANVNNDSCDAYYNIIADPMFFNPDKMDYRLNYDSPCIDAGTNDVIIDSVDFYGNERIYNYRGHNNANIDIGAFEFIEQPVSVNEIRLNQDQILNVYPNPILDRSIISFNLDKNEIVTLKFYDTYGRIILDMLKQEPLVKGNHQIKISRNELIPGIYFIVLQTNLKIYKGKVIVL